MAIEIMRTGNMVKRLQMRHHRAANEALEPLGVSIAQWDALRHIGENPGASLHDLALLTFQTDQSFGTLAGRIDVLGLIERVPGPGRAIRHRLTGEGERIRKRGAILLKEVLEESFSPLSAKDLATFDRLLSALLAQDR
jgi:DNA-binding MarR family transcriptional regulator